MPIEIIIAILFFIFAIVLISIDIKFSLTVLLFLSILLHKEVFSIYKWDILPVRLFMLALLVVSLAKYLFSFGNILNIRKWWVEFTRQPPFVLLLLFLWLIRGISIVFTKNLTSSLNLFGFFTAVVVLGTLLYGTFSKDSQKLLAYLKTYFFIIFGLCVFAYFQAFLYFKSGVILGALWNVPNNLPRLGSTFWDVNHFGALLAATLPVIGGFILISKTWKARGLYIAMFLPMLVILLLTNSRTAWILAFIAFVTFVVITLFKKWGLKGVGVVVAALVLASTLFVIEYSDKSSPVRARVKNYFHYRIDSFDSHILLLRGAFAVFAEKPILGGGYGGFFEHFAKTLVAAEYFGRDPAALNTRVPAHTIWGEVLAETGVLGLCAFSAFMGLGLCTLLYLALHKKYKKQSVLGTAMFSVILGWLIAGVFYSYKSEFFFLLLFSYFIYAISVLGKEGNIENVLKFVFFRKWVPLLALVFISAFLIFINLGANHLLPWDEAIYAKIAKNMVESGNHISQTWKFSIPWFEKPPLYMWFVAGCMRLFGMHEWAIRIPTALFGLGTILLVYFAGKRFFSKLVGFFSAFVLLTTTHFLYYSRISMLDVATTFFISAALFCYLIAREKMQGRYWIVSGVLIGLAIMTKGVVGALAIPIIALYEGYLFVIGDQKFSRTLPKYYGAFFGASLIVLLPWHIEMYRQFGKEFLANYIGYHVWQRATVAIEDKGNPFWWYLEVLKVSMRIWFIALLGAFPFTVIRAIKEKSKKHIFLTLWSVFVLVFFSLAKSKLVWYIMPIYPAAALMVGIFIDYLSTAAALKWRFFKNDLLRYGVLTGLVVFGLFYLFLNRELVYRPDLTGAQAILLQKKNEEFGDETIVYADRIELPLILFYLDGPFEVVDFGPLGDKLAMASYAERIVFITKESRFRAFKAEYDQLDLVAAEKEWVLGYLPSRQDVDRKQLENAQKILNRVDSKIRDFSQKGEELPAELLLEQADLQFQVQVWTNKINQR